jgi:hypothetical protein
MKTPRPDDVDELFGRLRAALQVTPSETFEAGVRARAAAEPARRVWWWAVPMSIATAVAVIAIVALRPAGGRRPAAISVNAADAAPALPVPSVATTRGAINPSPARVAHPHVVEAIVPEGEAAALMKFAAGVQSGRFYYAPIANDDAAALDITALAAPAPLEPKPIVIEPLAD